MPAVDEAGRGTRSGDLAGAMVHEKAVRAFIIASGGFSETARRWAKGKNIVLADEREINRLVQSAYRETK